MCHVRPPFAVAAESGRPSMNTSAVNRGGQPTLLYPVTWYPANAHALTIRTTNQCLEHRQRVWVPPDQVNRQICRFSICVTVGCASIAHYEGQVDDQFRLHQQWVNTCQPFRDRVP